MPPMPYAMEIGSVFSLLNDYVEDPQHMVHLLKELRAPGPTRAGALQVFASASAGQLPVNVQQHVEQHWFGYPPGQTAQPQFNSANPVATGWWTQWYGDADKITRESLVRGLEVALGIEHVPGEVNFVPTRHWRLQFNWTCGAPFFQGWVSWMWDEDDPAEGIVTVTFTTPGNGHPLFATPYRPPSMGPAPGYDPAPDTDTGVHYGMWVVGQAHTELRRPGRRTWQRLGRSVLPNAPNAFVRTYGDVVVVAPAEEDGGVLPAGRPWF